MPGPRLRLALLSTLRMALLPSCALGQASTALARPRGSMTSLSMVTTVGPKAYYTSLLSFPMSGGCPVITTQTQAISQEKATFDGNLSTILRRLRAALNGT